MGTVTHQNIGYLFPMGPYYWLLEQIGLPDWVAQRLWLGSLLFAAGAGVLYLLRTFGLRGPGVVVAALAYMLTPYTLDYAARISVLLMPWAALPWMIGLVRKALRDGGWRYPAIFALVVQVVGGVNATALLFAGLGPALWVLYSWLVAREVQWRRALGVTAAHRRADARRVVVVDRRASRCQGGYGLNILRYTETVEAVARTSTPNEILRGLGYWFFYGQDRLGPWIEAVVELHAAARGHHRRLRARRPWRCSRPVFVRWRHRVFFVGLLVVGVIIAVGAHPVREPDAARRVVQGVRDRLDGRARDAQHRARGAARRARDRSAARHRDQRRRTTRSRGSGSRSSRYGAVAIVARADRRSTSRR